MTVEAGRGQGYDRGRAEKRGQGFFIQSKV